MSPRLKVAFISNYLNHHQIPFCNEMHSLLGDDFRFIAAFPPNLARLGLGWRLDADYPYAVKAYESHDNYRRCIRLGEESDVVIIGSAPDALLGSRLRDNKLTFRYSERLFKQGFWRLLGPRTMRGMYRAHTRLRNANVYMLCASGYTAYDCARIFAYPDKLFKWGYFPEYRKHNPAELLREKGKPIAKLLWAGRFLDWKHTEDAIAAAAKLKNTGCIFELDIIGSGPQEEYLQKLVASQGLRDSVTFLGPMPPEKVRDNMEKADIFLFTSSRMEGWGAVLNEAMNSGCAVVASHAIGSVPFLVKHGENGLIYKSRDTGDLYRKVRHLLDNPADRVRLGENAASTIAGDWNPAKAAANLIALGESLLRGDGAPPISGPCSKAEIISDGFLLKTIHRLDGRDIG